MWLDNGQKPVYSNTTANLGGTGGRTDELGTPITGFNELIIISNYEYITSGICAAVDIDDIAISTTGHIGPLGAPVSIGAIMLLVTSNDE